MATVVQDVSGDSALQTAIAALKAKIEGAEESSDISQLASEINTVLAGKQNTLTFDSTPTAGSSNPVTSGGVKAALDEMDEDISSLNEDLSESTSIPSAEWQVGWIGASGGRIDSTGTTAITSPILPVYTKKISVSNTYKFRMHAYGVDGYKGIWNGSTFVTYNPNYFMNELDIGNMSRQYPYLFAIVLYRVDGATISVSEGENVVFSYDTERYFENSNSNRFAGVYMGYDINPKKHGISYISYNDSLPRYPSGTTSRQGMDMHNGKAYILASSNKLMVVDVLTNVLDKTLDITSGHGNSCQFSKAILTGETLPHLFCYGYNDKKVYENRILDNGTELVNTFYLPITGYRISGGYDSDSQRLMTLHYTGDNSTDPTISDTILSVWDMSRLTNNGDGTYSPALISSYQVPFLGVIQDCKIVEGVLYCLSGPNGGPVKLTVYNNTTMLNSIVIPDMNIEPEGIAFVDKGSNYDIWLSTSRFEHLYFE